MGSYINNTKNGDHLPAKGKKQALLNDGAIITDDSLKNDLVLIIEFKALDTAVRVNSVDEYEYFKRITEGNIIHWLVYPTK